MTTPLPSFIELMASLGLDQTTQPPNSASPSPRSSPSQSPRLAPPGSPLRSQSSPSLRDQSSVRRVSRYSPYASGNPSRNSCSSVSPSSDLGPPSARSYSTSPRPASMRRQDGQKPAGNLYDSPSDADTPISTYVRRKTPGTSPTSSTFHRDEVKHVVESPMPVTLPTLPALFPISLDAGSHSGTHMPAAGIRSRSLARSAVPDYRHHHTGVRISTPPRSADFVHPRIRRNIPPI